MPRARPAVKRASAGRGAPGRDVAGTGDRHALGPARAGAGPRARVTARPQGIGERSEVVAHPDHVPALHRGVAPDPAHGDPGRGARERLRSYTPFRQGPCRSPPLLRASVSIPAPRSGEHHRRQPQVLPPLLLLLSCPGVSYSLTELWNSAPLVIVPPTRSMGPATLNVRRLPCRRSMYSSSQTRSWSTASSSGFTAVNLYSGSSIPSIRRSSGSTWPSTNSRFLRIEAGASCRGVTPM